jgi:uncharacterized delta-60 repeat protein
VVGGNFTRYNGVGRRRIARLNEDGSLDTGFNPGTGLDLEVSSIALQPDGKVIIGGAFFSCNGISRNHIARLMSDGTVDTTFDPGTGASSRVNAMAVQSDGKVIIGGDFTTFNGTSCGHIARLNADGGLDSTFNPGTGANGSLSALAIQADGKILIGGLFTDYNGTARNYIARLNMNGSLDGSFDPGLGPDDDVSDIAIQSDGQIVIGGNFTGYSGSNNGYMVRLNPDGSQDMGFMTGAGPDSWVGSIAVQSDGRILAAGGFSMYDGINRNGIVRLNPDGSLDESFDPGTGPDDLITDIAIQEGGKALLGGMFTSYNGTGRNRVARIIADNGSGILEAGHHGSLCLVPNPATEEIRFLLKSSGDPWEVTILDAMGRTVKYTSTPVHAAQHTVNVSDLPPGSYAVCLKGRQGLATARFVKVRP